MWTRSLQRNRGAVYIAPLTILLLLVAAACGAPTEPPIERVDPDLDAVIVPDGRHAGGGGGRCFDLAVRLDAINLRRVAGSTPVDDVTASARSIQTVESFMGACLQRPAGETPSAFRQFLASTATRYTGTKGFDIGGPIRFVVGDPNDPTAVVWGSGMTHPFIAWCHRESDGAPLAAVLHWEVAGGDRSVICDDVGLAFQ